MGTWQYRFACTDSYGELINYITDDERSRDISYRTFTKYADLGPLRRDDHPAMWRISCPDNWAISFHESALPSGTPIVYFDWSRIEHVFSAEPINQREELALLTGQATTEGDQWKLEELLDNGADVDSLNRVTVYHHTSRDAADRILATGVMYSKEDGLFFSTRPDGHAAGYGPAVVKFLIPVSELQLDDVFGDEAHVRLPTHIGTTVVRHYLVRENPAGKRRVAPVPKGWSDRPAPTADKMCYRTKTDALNKFLDYNWRIVEEVFRGPNFGHGREGFDNINHAYELTGRNVADTLAKAVWWSLPGPKPWCLTNINVALLNEGDIAQRAGATFSLPAYAEEQKMIEEEEEWWKDQGEEACEWKCDCPPAEYPTEDEVPF
jgi:hypothetical protein